MQANNNAYFVISILISKYIVNTFSSCCENVESVITDK